MFSPPTSPTGSEKIDKKHLNYINQTKKSNGKVKEESSHTPSVTEQSLQVCQVVFNVDFEGTCSIYEKNVYKDMKKNSTFSISIFNKFEPFQKKEIKQKFEI